MWKISTPSQFQHYCLRYVSVQLSLDAKKSLHAAYIYNARNFERDGFPSVFFD